MSFLNKIQTWILKQEREKLFISLGYKPSQNTKITQELDTLLNATQMSNYLDKSYYDFKYNSKTLLKAFCDLAGISDLEYEDVIVEYEDNKRKLDALEQTYIFVYTNFKRNGEPIVALAAMENKRRIKLNKEIYLSQTQEEIDSYVSNLITLHHKDNNGILPMWGAIESYLYYDEHGEKTVYSTLGEKLENDSIPESRATLSL